MKPIERIYGCILIHNHVESRKMFSRIKEQWNELTMHKQWFSAMNELYLENEKIDVLTMVQKLRELKMYTKESMLKLSMHHIKHNHSFILIPCLWNANTSTN